MHKTTITLILLSLLLIPFTVFADDGIPLQTDVFLGAPIYGPEDLPEQITFNLYDSEGALVPLGSQTFTRGQYTVDFEFSKSDGVSSGKVARVNAEFTNKLDLVDEEGETIKPTEIWTALEVGGTEVGSRTKVPDETMVQLLLASDASMATYLTLVYEGDDNPITTIYKELPISSLSSDGAGTSLTSYFTSLASDRKFGDTARWNDAAGGGVYITSGFVGIGIENPLSSLHLHTPAVHSVRERIIEATAGESTYSRFGIGNFTSYDDIFIPLLYGFNNDDDRSGFSFLGLSSRDVNTNNIGLIDFNAAIIANNSNDPLNASRSYVVTSNILSVRNNGGTPKLVIKANGNVGISTTNPSYELAVNGTIRCKELIVDSEWADFVFEEEYRLPPLKEVKQFISRNRHLPGIPTEAEVKEKGVSVGEMSSKLLQKIEELTLYVIDLKKENIFLNDQIANLKKQMGKLKN